MTIGVPLVPEDALQALLAVREALAGRYRWWIQGGTLLGAMRDGGFIPFDHDIDIAVFLEDYDWLGMHRVLADFGFRHRKVTLVYEKTTPALSGSDGIFIAGSTPIHRLKKRYPPAGAAGVLAVGTAGALGATDQYHFGDVPLDIIGWSRRVDGHYIQTVPTSQVRESIMPAHGFCEVELCGETFLAPDPPEQWLELAYGSDWREPMESWHWSKTPVVRPRPELNRGVRIVRT